jgi:DNA polymerase-3 subunit beta
MKTSVTRDNLIKAITQVGHIIHPRNPLEILATIKVATEKNTLVLQANNLEVALQCSIPASVTTQGSICVPTRLFQDLITNISDEKIELQTQDNTMLVKTTNTNAEIAGFATSEFPAIPEVANTQSLSLPVAEFRQGIARAIVAVGIDNTRPVLSGIYLATRDKTLTLAATDSYRLCEQQISIKPQANIAVIVPAATLQEVLRLLQNVDSDNITINISEAALQIEIDSTLMVAQLINGKYPDYTKIIPDHNTTELRLNREELLRAVRTTALFSREGSLSITLTIASDKLSLKAQTTSVGTGESSITIPKVASPATIVVNAKYLSDALNCLDSEMVSLGFNSELEPLIIRPIDKADHFVHIIMPLRG